jgi:hypothetical protein
MPQHRLPSDLPNERVRNALQRLGFRLAREGKHAVYARGSETLPLPRHARLARNTLVKALARVGVTEEEFMAHY